MSETIRIEIESNTNSYTGKQDYSVTDLYNIDLFSNEANLKISIYEQSKIEENNKIKDFLFTGNKIELKDNETKIVNQLFTTQKVTSNSTISNANNSKFSMYLISSVLLISIFVFIFLRFFSNRKKGELANDNKF